MRRIFLLLVVSALLASPLFVSAQPINPLVGPLVPCDGAAGEDLTGKALTECQACHVVQLGQRIINFLVAVAAVIAVVIFAWAGFLMLTAAGDMTKISSARSMFWNVLIGLIIVLAGWLIIDTVMKWAFQRKTDTDNEKGSDLYEAMQEKFGPWNQILCVTPVKSAASAPSASPSGAVAPGQRGGSCDQLTTGHCSVSSLQNSCLGAVAGQASQICNAESGGIPTLESHVDILPNSGNRSFSVGLFQINLTVHTLSCGGKTLDCPSAFRGKDKNATIINEKEPLYEECKVAAATVSCNIQKACEIYRKAGNWSDWSTAKKCGV